MIILPQNPLLRFWVDYSEMALKAKQVLKNGKRECFYAPVNTQEALQAFAKLSQRLANIRNLGAKLQKGFQSGLQGDIRNLRNFRNDPTPLKKSWMPDIRRGWIYG